ncbi:MAG: prenyltransferase/squalene oxidase repeat-containing protein [Planctomycetota bacterium]|nr:prenyltransferase/squalene oxidase repeat-containing protein [Planctomycetota bacterium]
MTAYLQELTMRLSAGLGILPEAIRQRHTDYVKSQQQEDGGFAGREGSSDLYYTSFALRSLAILGELEGQTAEKSAHFVERRLSGQESIVDFFSLIYSGALLDTAAGIDVFSEASPAWKSNVAGTLEKLRREDGGYAKGAEGAISSTYHTFLVLICLQLLEYEIPSPDRVIQFLNSQAGDDGGFREIRASKRAGTNPTAAAIATLRILGGLTPEIRESTLDLLVEMQTDEGGLRANTRIPIADLLSTFTGSLTLLDLDGLNEIDTTAVVQYIASMEREEGGFHAAAWDTHCDVEYTFYGLGCRALFAGSG